MIALDYSRKPVPILTTALWWINFRYCIILNSDHSTTVHFLRTLWTFFKLPVSIPPRPWR